MVAKIELQKSLEKLPFPATAKWPHGVWDITPFNHGTMSVILFAPEKHDYQTPHEQDEIYVVFKGNGKLVTPTETFDFVPGDVLFVSAGDEHHFEEFSDDLVLWAVFYGPKGGEH
jgi:mannose-6-phosphate isomerase-like protein (cupin superfamily)